MKKLLLISVLISISQFGFSQVGINTTSPDAQLDIKSSNQVTPANTDGILIPKIDAFPVTNPTAAQNSMLVYLTTVSAGKQPGFYYWDSTGTPQWRGFGGTIPNGTAIGNTMYWNGTTWVNNSSFLFNNGTAVGVNTTTPSSVMTVRQNGIGFTQEDTTGSSKIGFYTLNSGAWLQTHSNTDLKFATNNGATQMVLQTATGNLGINTLTPAEKLDVMGKTKTTDLQVTNGAATGRILTSDATGNATWQLPAVLTAWSTTGNASTNPSTHFIGTTDNVDFVFKRYSIIAGKIAALNTSLGVNSLLQNPTGTGNNAFGRSALQQAATAMDNNAVGNYSLLNNHTGSYNNALGNAALNANTTSGKNVAIGNQALYSHGYSNGLVAYDSNNVAVGFESMYLNNPTIASNGIENVAVGSYAMRSNTTGYQNVAFGYRALFNNQTGYYNTCIGYNVYPSSGTNLFNYTGIGYNVGGGSSTSNSVELGNGSVGFIRAQVTGITAYSDRRIKTNIKSNVPGLEFITKLKPVTYNLDLHKQNAIIYRDKKEADTDWEGKYDIEKVTQTGFIAQEVAEAAQVSNYDFNGVAIPKKPEDLYGVNYTSFVVPLVKAVQEQQEIIEIQIKKIQQLEKVNEEILKRLEKLENE